MQFLQSLDRKTLTISSLVVAALFLFFVNVLSNAEIRSVQVDLTESKLFTLSEGTENILKTIKEPLTFRYYSVLTLFLLYHFVQVSPKNIPM